MVSSYTDQLAAFPPVAPAARGGDVPLPLGGCPTCGGELEASSAARPFREIRIGRTRVRIRPALCPYPACGERLMVVSSGYERVAMTARDFDAWWRKADKRDARSGAVASSGLLLGNLFVGLQAWLLTGASGASVVMLAFPAATLSVGLSLLVLTLRANGRARHSRRLACREALNAEPTSLRPSPRAYRAV